MFKLKVFKKTVAIVANLSLLLNSFVPLLLVAQPVYAQNSEAVIPTVEYNQSTNKLNINTGTSQKIAYQLFYKTDEKIDAIVGNDLSKGDFYLGTCSSSDCLPQNINRGILKTETDSNQYYSQFFTIENDVLVVVKELDSTQADLTAEENDFLNSSVLGDTSDWTFQNVELNKEYVAPQNSGVKLTFIKLPNSLGNIKIEEITLTPEQIEQTGALSDKAYDITSDMTDGTFEYNLSLPIPDSSKGQDVDIKFAEDISKIDSTQSVENTITNTDTSVSIKSLDHFTIFIVSATLATATLNNQSQVTVYPNDIIKATLNVNLNKFSGWRYSAWRIGNDDWNNIDTPDHLNLIWSTQHFSEDFNLTAPNSVGIYDVYFKVCPLNPFNDCETIKLTNGITVNPLCGNSRLDLNEECDNGSQNGIECIPGYNSNCNYCNSECEITTLNNFDIVKPKVEIIEPSFNGQIVKSNGNIVVKYTDDQALNQIVAHLSDSNNNFVPSVWSHPILSGMVTEKIVTLGLTSLTDGTYALKANASDKAANTSSTQSRTFTIDNTPPIATIDNIAPKSFYNGSTDINVHVIDNNYLKTELYQDGSNSPFKTYEESIGTEFSLFQLSDGKYKMVVIDKANNSTEYSFTIDKVAPTFKLTDDSNPSVPIANGVIINPDKLGDRDNNGNTIRFSKESVSDTLYLNNNPIFGHGYYNKGTSGQIGAAFVNEGTYTLYTKDESGNQSSATTFIVDKTAPSKPLDLSFSTTNGTVLGCNKTTNQHTIVAKWGASTDTNFSNYEYQSFNPTTGWIYSAGNIGDVFSRTGTLNGGEGTYGFAVRAVDKAGNVSDWTSLDLANSCQITYDATAPLAPSLINPGDDAYVKSNPTQSWNSVIGTDHYIYESYKDTAMTDVIYTENNLKTTSRTVGGNQNIVFYWRVKAVDLAGNESPWSGKQKMTIDNVIPSLPLQTEFSNWYNTTQTSYFTYSDINLRDDYIDPNCIINTEGSNQTCSIVSNICDKAGNCNTTTVTSNPANLDFTDPTSTINGGGNNSTVYSSSWDGSLSGNATDNLSGVAGVQVSIKNGANKYFNGSNFSEDTEFLLDATYNESTNTWGYFGLTNPLEDSYTVKSHAIDNAGNVENTYTLTIILDKTIPEVGISLNPSNPDASNGWYKTQPEITLTNTDSHLDKIQYKWDNGSWVNYAAPFKLENEGAHILYYKATDLAGNTSSDNGVKNIKWDQTDLENGPQNISANPNPTSGSISKIKWEIAKDNIGIDKYEIQWKLNDNNNPLSYSKTVGAGTTEVEIDQLIEGRWTVKVVAFDQSGKTKDNSIDVIVDRTGPAAPILTLTGTTAGTVNLSWNAISDAKDYIIWYGSTQGIHQFGARVGNVTSYTVQGLGAGNYYFIVKAVDEAQNQSVDSNEVNTGNISGAPGTTPGQPAEGFSPEVLGTDTDNQNQVGDSIKDDINNLGKVLGVSTKSLLDWWWLSLLLIIPIYVIFKKVRSKKKNR